MEKNPGVPTRLLIDCGNTRLKWAMTEAGEHRPLGQFDASGWVLHQDATAWTQLIAAWKNLSAKNTAALISNVAGVEAETRMRSALASAFGASIKIEWLKASAQAGSIRNFYEDPTQLGVDRFAAMIGATALFPSTPLLVINCGTALTIDHVTASGEFLGGMIMPGLRLMTSSLTRNTAQLPAQSFAEKIQHMEFPRNTQDGINSGCLSAQVGAVQQARRYFKNYLQQHPAAGADDHLLGVISGGDATLLRPLLCEPDEIIDNLVLLGLHALVKLSA